MKKLMKMIFPLTVAGLLISSAPAVGQGRTKGYCRQPVPRSGQYRFIDKNHNGICDRAEQRMKTKPGRNFVDKNGDGICDNRKNNAGFKGQGFGQRNGPGYCRRYAD